MMVMEDPSRTECVGMASVEKKLAKVHWPLEEVSLYVPGTARMCGRGRMAAIRTARAGCVWEGSWVTDV